MTKTEKPEEEPGEEKEKEKPKVEKAGKKDGSLVPLDTYLAAGVHIGTQRKLKDMEKFIYKVRPDGLCVLDVGTVNNRIGAIANFLSQYTPEKILVVCARDVGKPIVKKFADSIGAVAITTRFMPGSLTNPAYANYTEPGLLLAIDPGADKQPVKEALDINIPIVALCDTNNMTQNIDLILPVNNKGKKSLALVFWLLTREILKKQGKIKKNEDFKVKLEDFEEEK